MLTPEFRDALQHSTFSYNNTFNYTDISFTNFFFPQMNKPGAEYPYILNSGIHQGNKDSNILIFSNIENQLQGRTINTAKMKEILDGAQILLKIKVGEAWYLMGKGFLATFPDANNMELLFVATSQGKVTSLTEVKYYVSRALKRPDHKKVEPVIRDFLKIHHGDVTITNEIREYVCPKIPIPKLATVAERHKFVNNLVLIGIEAAKKATA